MPKKCKPGLLWAARDEMTDMCGKPSEVKVGNADTPIPVFTNTKWNFEYGVVCYHGFRRTFGRAPRKDQAICIDTTRREWWCPGCKEWVTQDEVVAGSIGCQPYHHTAQGVGCTANVTRSRCIVVDTLRLKGAEEK